MKKFLLLLTGVLLAATMFTGGRASASTQDFTVESFSANYFLDKRPDGVPTMRVEETIQARFPEFDQNHGILRALPQSYKGQTTGLKVESVKDDAGQPVNYSTGQQNGNLVLKIGDANQYVHGVVHYYINYSLKNPISFYGDHDELYWNVNGVQWQQPFAKVSSQLHLPADLAASLLPQLTCFTGTYGSSNQNCSIGRQTSGDQTIITTATTQSLAPGGNLSFVVGFKKGTFSVDKAAQRQKILRRLLLAGLVVGPPLLTAAYMFIRWLQTGRDDKGRGTIVPQYVPPKGFNSLTSDVLVQEELRQKAVTALVIELAIRKYISISETATDKLIGKKTDYTLTLLKSSEDLTTEERAVIQMFFNDYKPGTTVGMLGLKNTMAGDFKRLATNAPEALTKAGYFKANPVKAVSGFRGVGIGVLFTLVFFGIYFIQLSLLLSLLMVGVALSALVVLIFSRYMPARTTTGVAVLDYLKGLKMYMQLAEADRLKYLQSPEGVRQWGDPANPQTQLKLFEKLLPYAIIFDIEKDWAKQFEGIYQQPPDWYTGNWSHFSTGYLIGSLGNFTAVSSVAFAPAQSSGGSGFGGGGFSGGGGGGGGGGGW